MGPRPPASRPSPLKSPAASAEIINADSMQVYRDLQVISARPTEEEMVGVPAHLFGHVDAATRFSTGEWLEAARAVIKRLERQNKHAIFVGGTGSTCWR